LKVDRKELITLRISLARIAQAAGVCPATFGSLRVEQRDGYWALYRKAVACNRGWNRLALEVVDRLRNAGEAATGPLLASVRQGANGSCYGDDEAEES